jgi:Tfp pilus assembly protein PilX
MRIDRSVVAKLTRKQRRSRERGVALITALVLLLLLSGLVTAMVYSLRSDLMMNGYYRNFRGSFYAADSGLNVVREDFNNKLDAMVQAVSGTLALNTAPLAATDGGAATVKSYINSTYGSSYTLAGTGASSTAANSWPESFSIDATQTVFNLAPNGCSLTGGTGGTGAPGTCAAPIGNPTQYTYIYNYQLTSIGTSQNNEKTTLTDEGQLKFVINLTPNGTTTTNTSFAAWGMFIDQQSICNGSTLVPGTINGPVFTNGSWNFGVSSTKYVFTDTVGSAGGQAGYDFGSSGGSCDQVAGNSDSQGGTTIAPTFQKGFKLGQNTIPLPTDSLNQEQAVIDGLGRSSGAVTNSTLNLNVKDVTGTAYPTGGASSGVYLPYSVNPNPPHNNIFTGGGIYVEGSADIKLQLGATSTQQVYKITQGGNVTTITVDTSGSGTTTISDSSHAAITISGIPMNNNASPATPGTSLYVDGAVTSLTGPGEGVASIQDGSALTITANGNIAITGDLIYKTSPVDSSDNLVSGAASMKQVLGIFTANGDIQLNDTQKNSGGSYDGNLEIDASIATIASGGTGGLVNTGSSLNYLKIVGGRIQNNIKNINASTRDVFFDKRFAGSFAPPFFPSTTVTTTTTPTSDTAIPTSPSFSRTRWINKSTVY